MNYQTILAIIGGVIVGWFAIGMIYNLRRGDKLLKWMQDGLPLIGQRTTFRWLGSSVAEMGISKAKRPFQRMDVLLVLKPRDIFWMTIIALLQRRNDFLIFRAALSTPPLLDLELADPKTWSGREALSKAAKRNWEATDYHGLRLMAPKGLLNLAVETVDRLSLPMHTLSARYIRLSLRKTAPNMELHLPFPDPNATNAKTYFQSLLDLGHAVGER
ncbi:MAG: hypothetical protein ACOYYF_03870 [Chloroflexota bacterium]|nr:hypothetical protein [Chloroflexota bacterium]MBI5703813.1 hypothetical protein [Chloroflexota bacterium]